MTAPGKNIWPIFIPLLAAAAILLFVRDTPKPGDGGEAESAPADTTDWKTYRNEAFGLEIRYPDNYFLCPGGSTAYSGRPDTENVSLKENTSVGKDCVLSGKRIGFEMYRLGSGVQVSFNRKYIKLTAETTLDEIAAPFLEKEPRQMVRRACEVRDVNKRRTLICTEQAPGEAEGRTSGIYEIWAYTICGKENGERILVKLHNSAGGTHYTRDRALRRDVLRILDTLR